MFYHDITKCDMLNGPGLRVVLWVAGCNHYCKGCQNPQTWDPNSGIPYDEKAEEELFEALNHDYIEGLTFCGGDPLYPGNREEVFRIAEKVKSKFPDKSIWCYTGYTWEDIIHLLKDTKIDVLLDGEFIQEKVDNTLHWVGSPNQRIINIHKSIEAGEVVIEESIYE